MSAIFSITSEQDFDTFATNLAKHTKLKPTHVRSAIAKTRGYQTVKRYKDALESTSQAKSPAFPHKALEQIERAYKTIEDSTRYRKNNLDNLAEISPIFANSYQSNTTVSDSAIAVVEQVNAICSGATATHMESLGESIIIECKYHKRDSYGRAHYLNTVKAQHNGNTVTFAATTVLEHDNSTWTLLRETHFTVMLNDTDITQAMEEEATCLSGIDYLIHMLCPDFDYEFIWHNPIDAERLSKAQALIAINQSALSALQSIEGM